MSKREFEKLVKKAIISLPEHIRKKMDNVAIVIEKNPSRYELDRLEKSGTRLRGLLLGLYQGVPQTTWGRSLSSMRLPDKITIFKGSIERLASSEKEIRELVKIVIWHEIAHHFGFSEPQVRALEEKWRKEGKI